MEYMSKKDILNQMACKDTYVNVICHPCLSSVFQVPPKYEHILINLVPDEMNAKSEVLEKRSKEEREDRFITNFPRSLSRYIFH